MTEVLDGMCQICESQTLVCIPEFSASIRVTSDIKPWPSGGTLAWCENCQAVQSITDEAWHRDCAEIYAQYSIYELSGGSEQKIFDQASGHADGRSECLLRTLDELQLLPDRGRLLDVGCGNGAMLRAFGKAHSAWKLTGQDVQSRHSDQIRRLPGVEHFITGDLTSEDCDFDLISMIHVFEHIPQPGRFLMRLISHLKPGGHVLIQVPDCEATPYMYMVADHALHFSLQVLENVVRTSGFEVVFASRAVFGKEITLIATPSQEHGSEKLLPDGPPLAFVRQQARWLHDQVTRAEEIKSESNSFGIFGTSVAATWLMAALENRVEFFVDEDVSRVGKLHHGIPVLAPDQVPAGSDVIICQPNNVAEMIANRLANLPVSWHLPVATT